MSRSLAQAIVAAATALCLLAIPLLAGTAARAPVPAAPAHRAQGAGPFAGATVILRDQAGVVGSDQRP